MNAVILQFPKRTCNLCEIEQTLQQEALAEIKRRDRRITARRKYLKFLGRRRNYEKDLADIEASLKANELTPSEAVKYRESVKDYWLGGLSG